MKVGKDIASESAERKYFLIEQHAPFPANAVCVHLALSLKKKKEVVEVFSYFILLLSTRPGQVSVASTPTFCVGG